MPPAAQALFIAEAKDHLIDICTGLLLLEKEGEQSIPQKIESIQRAVHSIKGGAGFLGLTAIETLAHRMETVLGKFSAEGLPDEARLTDALLEATDCLTVLLDDSDLGIHVDLSEILDKLVKLAPENPEGDFCSETSQRVPEEIFECSFELDSLASAGISPMDLFKRINAHGKVISGHMETALTDLEAGPPKPPFIWHTHIASPLNQADFLGKLELPEMPASSKDMILAPAEASTGEPVPQKTLTREPGSSSGTQGRSGTIRIPIDLIDQLMSLAGELVLVRNQAKRYSVSLQPLPGHVMQRLDAVTSAFQDTVLQTRMQPVATVFNKYPRLIRDLSRQLNKQIELQISGGEVELDKNILEALSDPLTHLIRNACDHGLESAEQRLSSGKPATGKIKLEARHLGDQILISFTDDGRGIDREAVRNKTLAQGLRTSDELARLDDRDLLGLILMPGFSTAAKVSDISGRGVGMDVVKTNLAAIGGSIEIESAPGTGTTFLLRLPLTLAIIPTLLVMAGGERYALPQKDIEELVYIDPAQSDATIEKKTDGEVVRLRGTLLPLVRLAGTLAGISEDPSRETAPAEVYAVVRAGSRRFGLVLDSILNNEEIVVKPLHSALKHLPMYSGATILGDGRVALILNPDGIAQRARIHFHAETIGDSQKKIFDADQQLSVLRVRQCSGQLLGIPMVDVLRIVMCHECNLKRLGDQSYMMIGDQPTQILTTLTEAASEKTRPLDIQPSFVVLLRHHSRSVGLAVSEVIGAEWISSTSIHQIDTGVGSFRAVAFQGNLFPLASPVLLEDEVLPLYLEEEISR